MDHHQRHDEFLQITSTIIKCAYKVSNTLGCGYLEKVYENALLLELHKSGLKATGIHLCLLINFGKPRVDVKRIVNNY
jgi:hypothetical protein